MRLIHRSSALLLCVALLAGNAGVCAGWAATSEARMDCCTDGTCPMHKGESRPASDRTITQLQADNCCAASERQHPNSPTPTSIAAITIAVLGAGVVVPTSVPDLVLSDDWRTGSPIPTPPVPRHILLSVFLV